MTGAAGLDAASAEATAVFLMRLRGRGIRDLSVLRAIEETPRRLFAPQRYRDLAFRELHLPLPCGQSMPDAFFVARLADALELRAAHRLLEIGAGSGYCTAVFARLCAEVIAVERYRTLVIEARARLEELRLSRARVEWADGRALPAGVDRFDRIVVHAALDSRERAALLDLLAPDGVLVCGEAQEGAQEGAQRGAQDLAAQELAAQGVEPAQVALVHVARAGAGGGETRRLCGAARLRRLEPGLAAAL